jgi:integrase
LEDREEHVDCHTGVTPHALRHTYAALAVSAGANPKVLEATLGHSDIRLILDTYGGLFGDDLDSLADSLDRAISNAGCHSDVTDLARVTALGPRPDGRDAV